MKPIPLNRKNIENHINLLMVLPEKEVHHIMILKLDL